MDSEMTDRQSQDNSQRYPPIIYFEAMAKALHQTLVDDFENRDRNELLQEWSMYKLSDVDALTWRTGPISAPSVRGQVSHREVLTYRLHSLLYGDANSKGEHIKVLQLLMNMDSMKLALQKVARYRSRVAEELTHSLEESIRPRNGAQFSSENDIQYEATWTDIMKSLNEIERPMESNVHDTTSAMTNH